MKLSPKFVGQAFFGGIFTGFVQTNASAVSCAPPTCTLLEGRPNGINDAGVVVGNIGSFTPPLGGYVYTGGAYLPVNDTDAATFFGTAVQGINDSDEIVGYYINANPNAPTIYSGILATPTAPLVPEPRTLPVLFVCLLAVAVGLKRKSKRVRQDSRIR